MIKIFKDKAAYDAAPKPTIESQVSMLESTNAVMYDGVNVITTEPRLGDILYLDESNAPVFISAATFKKANVPSAWTYVGEVIERVDSSRVRVLNKTLSTLKYCDVLQYALTAIVSTDLTLKLRIRDTSKSGDAQYATAIDVPVTLTSTAFDATTVAEITAALEAKATELGDTRAWWCYLANNKNEKVDSDATRIVVQCDTWLNYQEYACGATGGTLTFAVWGDMPENSSNGFRVNGLTGNQKIMNVARGAAYYGTNGRTPTENVPLNDANTIVTKAAFDTSAYCALLRETYGTYSNYIEKEYKVEFPQKLGCFGLPDGQALTAKYGPMMAPTKDGGSKAKYPALNWAYNVAYNADGLRGGDWHLWDVREGCIIMDDAKNAAINTTRAAQGNTQISNATSRWFAQRYNVYNAWIFYGSNGYLSTNYVYSGYQVGAVALFKFQ